MKKPMFEYDEIEMDKIDVSSWNVRRSKRDEGLDGLAGSIEKIGLQQPIVVYEKEDGRYELIIGQRRYLACKRLGHKEIPALITPLEEETDATIRSFSENIHRLELEYRDKMAVATELLARLGSVGKVAEILGVSSQTVRNYLGYAIVPEAMKEMVEEGKLSATTARRIAVGIPDEERAIRIAKAVKEKVRAKDRRKVVEIARESPDQSPEEIIRKFKTRKFSQVTVDLTPMISEALERACNEYRTDAEGIALEAVEEWLTKRGFVE